MLNRLFVLLQFVLPQHALSRLMGKLGNCRYRWLKTIYIFIFIKCYHIDLSLAERIHISDYDTFNDFFTRKLKKDARPIAADKHAMVSPVDGSISQMGDIKENALFQAKGKWYSLNDLLGNNEWANSFQNGKFLTIYLAPNNYHRVHMPFAGELLEMIHLPGTLFSVNACTANAVPQLFARNERVISLFETTMGKMAVVMVGAMLVGSMKTIWAGRIEGKMPQSIDYRHQSVVLNKGNEMGLFEQGSTVILLFEPNRMVWHENLVPGAVLKMGQGIGDGLKISELP